MARARNIKPGFFRNADLVELPIETRMFFIGLWTIADRAGRLEDRPKQIKMELFPADSVDCDEMLNQLSAIGMVERYEHDGKRYLQVVNFCKHQNPHKDEKASTIPDRDGNHAETKQAQIKHGASTVQAPCKDDGNRADSLIPDSLIPESIEKTKAIRAPRFDAQAHLVSIGVDASIAADWLQHRKAVKAAPTLTAIDGIAKEAERAGISLSDALAVCCQRGWRGFKAEWMANVTPMTPAKSQFQINQEATARAIFGVSKRQDEPRLISGEVVA